MEPAHKTPLPVPNGVLKQQVVVVSVYRECLKNHAASLGGHALDGCGEFMASPSSNPSVPTSLTCAACGCHRNFHRRLPYRIHNPNPLSSEKQPDHEEEEDDDDEDQEEDEEQHQNQDRDEDLHADDSANDGETGENSSAPHMLLALSTVQHQPHRDIKRIVEEQQQPHPASSVPRKRRFRSKFSTEQKERMQDLSERLGWKMQKREEGLVEERCREIGIGKGVFKVWMHNNKHNNYNNHFHSPPPPPPPISISTLTPTVAVAAADSDGNGNDNGTQINGSSFFK